MDVDNNHNHNNNNNNNDNSDCNENDVSMKCKMDDDTNDNMDNITLLLPDLSSTTSSFVSVSSSTIALKSKNTTRGLLYCKLIDVNYYPIN